MMKHLAILIGIAAALLAQPTSVRADDAVPRVALVVGNASYPDADSPLKEAVNDARAMADELKHDGFDVVTGENLGREAMQQTLEKLYASIKPRSLVLVFFSGFGIQSGRQTFMIPIDAQIWTENDIRRDGVSLDRILDELNSRGAGVKLAILDASRRNPFERRFRAGSAGLAPPAAAPQNSLVMYSAAPGSVVDDAPGAHGLFVDELLKEMRAPDLTADEALSRTAKGVSRASGGVQVPWISSSLTEDFSFIEATKPPVSIPPNKPNTNTQANTSTESPVDNQQQQQKIPPQLTPDQFAYWASDPIVQALTDLLRKTPNDENLYYKRGQYFAGKSAWKLALADLDQAVVLDGKDVYALNNRCFVHAVVGDLQSALADCNAALKQRPLFVDALDSRGLVFLKMNLYPNALADFEAALKINAKLASSLYGRGLARQRTGQPAPGAADLRAAAQIDPDIASEFKSWGVQ
jgi:lipoprotein NlpI